MKKANTANKEGLTLKQKLLALFLVTVTVAILVFSDRTIRILSSVLEVEGIHHVEGDSEVIISRISLWKTRNETKLLEISDPNSVVAKSYIQFQNDPSPENKTEVRNQLERALFNDASIIEISIIDKDSGNVVISSATSTEGHPSMRARRSFGAMEKTASSSIFFSERINEHALFAEAPIKDEYGMRVANVRAMINIYSLGDILFNRSLLGETGEAYLVDYEGKAIIGMGRSPDYLNIKTDEQDSVEFGTIAGALVGEVDVREYLNYREKSVFGYQELLPELHAVFVYEKELAEVFAPIKLLTEKIRILLIVILAISALLASSLIHRFIKPIETLTKTAKQVAGGNYKVRAKIKSKDEIGILASKFNLMTDSLVSSMDEVSLKNALLQSQYNTSFFGILAIGNKGEIMSYNKGFKEIWDVPPGMRRRKQYKVLMDHMLKQVKDRKKFSEKLNYSRSTTRKTTREEIELKDGRVIEKLSANLVSKMGEALGVVFYFQDITKEIETNRAKTEFVSLASHQLQTPLTSIKWLLENLMELEKKNKNKYEIVKDAFSSTDRMIRLVNDLLNVSRLDAGLIAPDSQKVELHEFIRELLDEAKAVAKTKKIEIKFLESKSKLEVVLDKNLITNVILNLLSNAIRYSNPKKKVTVSIKKKGGKVQVAVKDQGIGISKSDQKKLFGKFFRSHKAAKHNTNGSGLELYVVKKILEICKGRISVESQVGKGSTFTVTLPIKGPATSKKGTKTLIQQRISRI